MSVHDSLLGKTVAAPERYAPELLFPIARERAGQSPWACGADDWTAWELGWLNADGVPQAAVADIRVPADSPNLIESKSLKLYLNSLNFTRVASWQALQVLLETDLSRVAGTAVAVRVLPLSQVPAPLLLQGICLDEQAVPWQDAEVLNTAALNTRPGSSVTERCLYSQVFRSCCPVTGQPDWASLLVCYSGQAWDETGLQAYLLSYRRHRGFHEQCVERIYRDVWETLQPESLLVAARFQRRGGLDINPWRASNERLQTKLPGRQPAQ